MSPTNIDDGLFNSVSFTLNGFDVHKYNDMASTEQPS